MKVVCLCDMAITPELMGKMKELELSGHNVVIIDDDMMQTPKDITRVMLKTEQEGADSCPANEQFIKESQDADIVVVHAAPVNKQVLESAKKLKYVMVLRSGIENVNKNICDDMKVQIINAPGRSAHAVADCTVGLMLSELKNIARGHHDLMNGKWTKKFPNFEYTHDLRNLKVGIIGAGQIGSKVIKRLSGFECDVIVHDPFISDVELEKQGYKAVTLEKLLQESDIVSLHLRLSETTENFIGQKELELMKPTSYLINVARSGLTDKHALVTALKEKWIGGGAFDVFDEEPLSEDNPFLSLDNVTITPHLAGTSMDTFGNSVEIIYDEILKLL